MEPDVAMGAVLVYLVRHRDSAVDKNALQDEIWPPNEARYLLIAALGRLGRPRIGAGEFPLAY